VSDPVTVALIVATGHVLAQLVQSLLHRRHERVTKDTNLKVTNLGNGRSPRGD
jgi:hypothetical protein